MRSLKTTCVALCLASLLSSLGCCYHAQHFGKRRDVGWGKVGCVTCDQCAQHDDCAGDCSHTVIVPANPVNPVNGLNKVR
jgi:hypothetical protein